ncbi:MAG TPA: hypothetical protein VNF29_08230 [Candidatus Binataceae bacterium]|nr:hypothetical protein [Candidatus Binataceae bacterium]
MQITLAIAAHRADTLAACDRVIFIKDGTLAASGPHAELLDSSPEYRAYLAVLGSEIHG